MTNTLRASLLSATCLALLAATPVFAQTTPPAEPEKKPATTEEAAQPATPAPTPAPAAATTAPAQRAAETVVVTGSRIRRDTFSSASPLTVVQNDNAVLSGTIDAAEILQGSIAAAGSGQINNFFSGFIVEGGPGIQTVGLNSLGSQRTLVLLNGRRLPPSGTRGQVGAVDLATIPNLAVSRFEILNEGASPIYGSDAVGGVVNAITRRDVNGLEIQAAGGISQEGGGEDMTVGALWGKTADRWNVMVSASYFKQNALKYGDRDFCSADYVFNATTGASGDFIDAATGKPKCFGIGPSFNRISVDGFGTWVSDPTQTAVRTGTNPSTGTGAPTLLSIPGYRRLFNPLTGTQGVPLANQIDYVHPLTQNTDIISPSERINLYATGAMDLDILGGVEIYGELIAAQRTSEQARAAQLFFPAFIAPTNAAINPFTVVGRFATPVIVRPANSEQEVNTWQVVGGIRGQTGGGLGGFLRNGNWDVYAQTSRGEGEYGGTTVRQDRLDASLTAGCPTPRFGGSCLPINFFDPRVLRGDYTAAEYDYLFNAPNVGKTVYEQTAFEANVSGDLFLIPGAADEIKANFGVYYRKYSIDDVPGAETLRGNQALSSGAGITRGEDAVREVYTEISAPLVARKPLIENLELQLAYRFTDYDSYDNNSTWKATLNWKITPEFAVIGIAGTSYRAPALFELFLGDQTGFLGQTQIDPCVNWGLSQNDTIRARCGAEGIPEDYSGLGSSATIFTGGGFGNLKEEESTSEILSFVYTPSKIDLNVRVDLWKINVTDQVAQFGAASIVGACYADTNASRAESFCRLFTRDNTPGSARFRQIISVENNYVNINEADVEGVDLKILYRKDFSFGDLVIDSQHRWTNRSAFGLFSDEELDEQQGEIGEPVYVSQNQVRFTRKDWTFAWTANAVGPTRAEDVAEVFAAPPGSYYSFNGLSSVRRKTSTETTITHDLSVRYLSDNWTLVGAVSNVFAEEPPSISTGVFFSRLGTAPLTSQYDFVGRTFTAQIIRRF